MISFALCAVLCSFWSLERLIERGSCALPRGHQCPRYKPTPDESGFRAPFTGRSTCSPAIDRRGYCPEKSFKFFLLESFPSALLFPYSLKPTVFFLPPALILLSHKLTHTHLV